ncbi:MAG: amidohydrolase family protein [Pseudomonadota bacterium]
MLIKNAEVAGRLVDIVCRDHEIVDIGPNMEPPQSPSAPIIDAAGCAVLPGLHDHHLHFFALAALRESVDLKAAGNSAAMVKLLREAKSSEWLRAVHYNETLHGELQARRLDEVRSDVPVRVQHSSGKMWVLNSRALARLDVATSTHPGVERYLDGRPTGRLFRMDGWLREAMGEQGMRPGIMLGRELASYGITGFTDCSYTNTQADLFRFHQILQQVYMMGDDGLNAGHLKIMLDEDALPDRDNLIARIESARHRGRGVAFHCVTEVELLFALSALSTVGYSPHDRIEHAALASPAAVELMAEAGVSVVTQPGFLADRGERYRREVHGDLADLYRYASLLHAGIPTAASSDGPYGPISPWTVMAAAVTRETDEGLPLGETECVSPQEALRGYLAPSQAPGGSARELRAGGVADFCILDRTWQAALDNLGAVTVLHTVIGGELVHTRKAMTQAAP